MCILHKEKQPLSLKGFHSESHNCVDCGYNTFPGSPPRELAEFLMNRDGTVPMNFTPDSEVYIVKEKIWNASGMASYGGCLCVGCLERRIGRRLKPKDFDHTHPFNQPRIPCTDRLRDRRGHSDIIISDQPEAWS
jgi:hypothetical protein